MNKETQKKWVLQRLRTVGSITSMEAFQAGITRLSAIIYDLRDEGFDVRTVMETGRNRQGNPTRYARYFLHEDASAEQPSAS